MWRATMPGAAHERSKSCKTTLGVPAGPCYSDRKDIVTGDDSHTSSGGPVRGVPEFWLKVLRSHPELEVC